MVTREDRHEKSLSQAQRFKQAARELQCDDDEARFDERVKKLVKHKPVSDKSKA